jgi:hypothetical protein
LFQLIDNTNQWKLQTPVALILFNRPDLTQQIFEVIREARPPVLLLIADGARHDRPNEFDYCRTARLIAEQVDWPCQVFKNYSEINLGCRKRVSSGLDWVFQIVEEAIILEDDCLPDPSFFKFCEDLLKKYRHDDFIMAISGDNFQAGQQRASYSYYFSRYNHIWGWASWRRAWKHYDLSMSQWPALRDSGWLSTLFDDPTAAAYWTRIFQLAYDGFDTWDYAWVFACWVRQGLVALPNKNLVTNIGFGQDATHTRNHSPLANLPVEPIVFPLCHPQEIARNVEADNYTERTQYSGATEANRILESKNDPSNSLNMPVCKICAGVTQNFDRATILCKYNIQYFKCNDCGFLQTEEPYWLDEAYSSAIASSDVGLVYRNLNLAKTTNSIISHLFHSEGKFLDYGGGYGLFVRLMRDAGFNFYWHDKYADNLFASGFEIETNDRSEKIELVTAFELFEHLANPLQEIETILTYSRNILFSTDLLPASNPKTNEWWYYCLEEGQHISFYTVNSLRSIAAKFGLNFYTNGLSLHLLTEKVIRDDIFKQCASLQLLPVQRPSLLQKDYAEAVVRIKQFRTTFTKCTTF